MKNEFSIVTAIAVALVALIAATSTNAGQGKGRVKAACKEELAQYCADKPHVRGEARACLEANKDKVSEACRTALDTSGPGRGKGKGSGAGQ